MEVSTESKFMSLRLGIIDDYLSNPIGRNKRCNSRYIAGHSAAQLLMGSNGSNVKKIANVES